MFEGRRRAKVAEEALEKLKDTVDTLIVIPNQKLLEVVDKKVSLVDAFNLINGLLNQFIKSIADIIAKPGHINVDFADIKTIMKQHGLAVIGTGRASGEDRALKAARQAIVSPLLDSTSITGAKGVLLNISGNSSLSLHEVGAASQIIYEEAHEDASIIVGSVIDSSLNDEIVVTIIATGFDRIVNEPVQPATSQSNKESAKDSLEEESPQEEPELDLNDLEIPAVMRQMQQKKRDKQA